MVEDDSVCLHKTHFVIILPLRLSASELRLIRAKSTCNMQQLHVRALRERVLVFVFICPCRFVGLGLLAESATMWK